MQLSAIKNLVCSYKSDSGSAYYFTLKGVYRYSNHWGRAANCRWKLERFSSGSDDSETDAIQRNANKKLGFAYWTDFYPNNEKENLFYIDVDFETKNVWFNHKNHPAYDGKKMCRNASETAKRIKICKQVLHEMDWCKYLKFDSLDELRQKVINELLVTNNSFISIKKKYAL